MGDGRWELGDGSWEMGRCDLDVKVHTVHTYQGRDF